jgi:hypothetical protein
MDPADIPLPPSPTIQPQETPLSPTPSSSSLNMFSPAPKQASSSPFNTPRNLASKLVRPTSTSSPVPAVSKLSLGNGPRTDSERDLFSLGQSRVDTPVLGDGKGVETPGAAMAEVEAMLAGVADSAANEENAAAALGDNVLPSSAETKPAVKAEEVNPESVPLPAEDASELPREELEQKYQSLLERTSKADQILKESSPILTEGINDADALEGWVRMITGKAEMATMEIKRLNDKLARESWVPESSCIGGLRGFHLSVCSTSFTHGGSKGNTSDGTIFFFCFDRFPEGPTGTVRTFPIFSCEHISSACSGESRLDHLPSAAQDR